MFFIPGSNIEVEENNIIIIEEECQMELKNYTAVGNSGTKKPTHTHIMIETNSSGTIYIGDSANPKELIKTTDQGENWGSSLFNTVLTRRDVYILFHDKTNDFIYGISDDRDITSTFTWWSIDLSDDTFDLIGEFGAGAMAADFLRTNGERWVFFLDAEAGQLIFEGWDTADGPGNPQIHQAMGAIGALTPNISFGIAVGATSVYFLFKWSNQNVELWLADTNADTFTEVYDFGANSDLSDNVDQYGIAYDGSNILTFILKDTGDGKFYQWTYNISGDSATKEGEMNVAVMMDRNTVSVPEKAFHLTEYKVYELHENTSNLYLIAEPGTGEVIVGITDNFFITTTGDVWESVDIVSYVLSCNIRRDDMEVPTATTQILQPYIITEGMFIRVKDMFTTAGSSSISVIFEGFVDSLSEGRAYTALLISPANEMENIRPSGDFSGRSDQIISSLITTYCKYITVGTLSAGGAMGTITFYGDKTMIQILTELAIFDSFIWSLGPTGKLFYNNGTVDTTINFNDNSHISEVKKLEGKRAINYVKIKGGFASGVQVVGTVAENVPDQQTNGKNPYERTHSHLNTNALCSTTATNALSRLGTQAKVVEFAHNDNTVGLMQEGETVTFERVGLDFTISSAQYGIRSVRYNAVTGKGYYIISDRII